MNKFFNRVCATAVNVLRERLGEVLNFWPSDDLEPAKLYLHDVVWSLWVFRRHGDRLSAEFLSAILNEQLVPDLLIYHFKVLVLFLAIFEIEHAI